MKKIKELLKKAWDIANGNKTIFFGAIYYLVDIGVITLTGPIGLAIKYIIASLAGVSLIHHFKKGSYKTSYK